MKWFERLPAEGVGVGPVGTSLEGGGGSRALSRFCMQ